jgi:AraC-like DNA-binding protein
MADQPADPPANAQIDHAQYVTLDELQPSVDLAACYDFVQDESYQYRVPGAHFLLVAEGRITCRSPSLGEAEARTGEMLCFPFADLNHYAVHAPTRYYEAHIQLAPPPRNRLALWLEGLGPLPLRVRLGVAAERMRAVFDSFCIELAQPGAVHRARVSAGVWDMLAILAEVVRPAGAAAAPRLDPWQRARQRLGSGFARELPVRELAAELDLSVDHFIRGFRARFGASPGQFRVREKLRHAAHRLRAGDEPIKAIARELGFADAYSFTRAFRRYLGVLPSDLREGRAALPAAVSPEKPLIPINQHVVPPDVGTEHFSKFVPRR